MFKKLFQNRKKHQEFLALWQPLLKQAMVSMPPELPDLQKPDRRFFIDEWNRFYEHADNMGKVGLAVLAYRLDIHRYAAGMLVHGNSDIRLAGVRLLGYMGDETAWPVLTAMLSQKKNQVSLAALAALFKINSRRAIDELSGLIFQRTDWPVERICEIIKDVKDIPLQEKLKQHVSSHAQAYPEKAQTILQAIE